MTLTKSARVRTVIAETHTLQNADKLALLKGYVDQRDDSYKIRYQKLPVSVDPEGTQIGEPKQYKIPAPGCVITGVSCHILIEPGQQLPDIDQLLGLYVENEKTGDTVLVSNFLPSDSYETHQGHVFVFDDAYSSGISVMVDNDDSSFVLRYSGVLKEYDVNMCHAKDLLQIYEINGRA